MKTLSLGLMISTLWIGACTLPAMLTGGGGGHAKQTTTSHTETTEEINGQPVDPGANDEPPPPELRTRKAKAKQVSTKDDFGATCKHNSDCESNTCFVGRGELGYCTKMCNSWSECPSYWECQRAANAPQKICMQD